MLRDYIFYPLSLHLKRLPFSRRHPDVATAIPPLITFLLVGFWHGVTIGFILYGLNPGHWPGLSGCAQTSESENGTEPLVVGVDYWPCCWSYCKFCICHAFPCVLWAVSRKSSGALASTLVRSIRIFLNRLRSCDMIAGKSIYSTGNALQRFLRLGELRPAQMFSISKRGEPLSSQLLIHGAGHT